MNQYFSPKSIKGALALAKEHSENYVYFGGGTDIQIYRKQKLINRNVVIDLSEIFFNDFFQVQGTNLTINAFATLEKIGRNKKVQDHSPILSQATQSVATPVIRKTATLGGNLLVNNRCTFYNQSKEWRDGIGSCMRDEGDICQVTGSDKKCYSRNVSDTAPALIALNASVTIQSQIGEKTIPLHHLYRADGIRYHANLNADAILTEIHIPEKPKSSWFKKLRLRKSLDFTSLTIAGVVDQNDTARICINGVSMSPVLIEESLNTLSLNSLKQQARKKCKTVNNDLMPLKYRKDMINVFLEEWWNSNNSF